jgi:N-acetylglucosaminyldiphosphoundecaprenol N-acetyl-beta-D-mannosaminyltransferase
MEILGVRIDKINLNEAKERIGVFLVGQHGRMVFTPNPEMLVDAQKDEYFKKILNSGDLNLCDGFGLKIVSGIQRITGIDFMLEICDLAQKEGRSVYLLGSEKDDVVKKTAENLVRRFPELKIAGYDRGLDIEIKEIKRYIRKKNDISRTMRQWNNGQINYGDVENNLVINNILKSGANILFVAFGHNKQEKWIYENLSKIPSVKIAMGVGGSFDYISGNIKRAPRWLRKIGLEWLYRLMYQPKRIRRIINATIYFIFLIIKNNLFNHHR